jgi:hypothetical protein
MRYRSVRVREEPLRTRLRALAAERPRLFLESIRGGVL